MGVGIIGPKVSHLGRAVPEAAWARAATKRLVERRSVTICPRSGRTGKRQVDPRFTRGGRTEVPVSGSVEASTASTLFGQRLAILFDIGKRRGAAMGFTSCPAAGPEKGPWRPGWAVSSAAWGRAPDNRSTRDSRRETVAWQAKPNTTSPKAGRSGPIKNRE